MLYRHGHSRWLGNRLKKLHLCALDIDLDHMDVRMLCQQALDRGGWHLDLAHVFCGLVVPVRAAVDAVAPVVAPRGDATQRSGPRCFQPRQSAATAVFRRNRLSPESNSLLLLGILVAHHCGMDACNARIVFEVQLVIFLSG